MKADRLAKDGDEPGKETGASFHFAIFNLHPLQAWLFAGNA
jgi:hypothetical protein